MDVVAARSFLQAVAADPPDRAAVAELDASWGGRIADLCIDPAARMALADLAQTVSQGR